MPKSYSIVAINHAKAEEFVKTLVSGVVATLVREPENPFDCNAVAVWVEGRRIGYIPKKQNTVLAQFIDQSGMAMDSVAGAKGLPGKFIRSPNSGYPMVEV